MSGIEVYTKEEFQNSFNNVFKEITKNKSIEKNPIAYFIGGQPGSGKTMLADMLMEKDENIVYINGDEYRKYHPRYKEIVEKYGKDAAIYTQKFSSEIIENLIENLGDKKYNLIIEGTLRTSEVPVKSAKALQKKGYQTDLHIIAVKPEMSYLGTLLRYEGMLACGLFARMTPKEHHDMVVKSISSNIKAIDESKVFRNTFVYNREKEVLFDSTKGDKNPENVIEKEFKREMMEKDIGEIIKGYETISEYMQKRGASMEDFVELNKQRKEALRPKNIKLPESFKISKRKSEFAK